LINAQIELNRKTLADLAIHDPDTFTKLVELAKANLPAT
jgi:ribosomal protein L20